MVAEAEEAVAVVEEVEVAAEAEEEAEEEAVEESASAIRRLRRHPAPARAREA